MVQAVAVAEASVEVGDAGDELGQVAAGRPSAGGATRTGPAPGPGAGGRDRWPRTRPGRRGSSTPSSTIRCASSPQARHDPPAGLVADHHPVVQGGPIAQVGPHAGLVGGPERRHLEGHDGLDVVGPGRAQLVALLHPGDATCPLPSGYGRPLPLPPGGDPGAGRALLLRHHRDPGLRVQHPGPQAGLPRWPSWASPSCRCWCTSSATRVAFRRFGVDPHITLVGMGGLTTGSGRLTPRQHIVVSLAGPLLGAGAVRAAGTVAVAPGHDHLGRRPGAPVRGAVDQRGLVGAQPAAHAARSTGATSPCRCSTWSPRVAVGARPRSSRSWWRWPAG